MTETRDLADLARSICPGDPPDLGIVWELHILREAGVETFESCEGGPDHSYSEPTIRFLRHARRWVACLVGRAEPRTSGAPP